MSRVKKTIKNAKIGILFFVIGVFLNFFSRKIFLEKLGDDFMGTISTIRNIIGFLNIADIGIVSSITYRLYKPIKENNIEEIQNLMLLFGYFYKKVAIAIAVLGVIFMFVLPFLFDGKSVSLVLVYFVFIVILVVSLLGYIFNYHQTLLIADQKDYVVRLYERTLNITKLIAQILLLIYFKNVFIWIFLELAFPILQSYLLRERIKKEYPWLVLNGTFFKESLSDYYEVIKKIKQSLSHRIGGFILNSTDQFFIFLFVNLSMVTFYGNYYLIVQNINLLLNSILVNIAPSVGNLISENNENKINSMFNQLVSFYFFIAGFTSIVLLFVINPFISIWLGSNYLLQSDTLFLIIMVFFLMQARKAVDVFINGYGLFDDIYAPVVEVVINLSITIILGKLYGINGVLIGSISSLLIVIFFWKPYFLFKMKFNKSILMYWIQVIPMLLFFGIVYLVVSMLFQYSTTTYIGFFLFLIKVSAVTFISLFCLFFITNRSFRFLVNSLLSVVNFRKKDF